MSPPSHSCTLHKGILDTTHFQLENFSLTYQVMYQNELRKKQYCHHTHHSESHSYWSFCGLKLLRGTQNTLQLPITKIPNNIDFPFQKLPHPPHTGFPHKLFCPQKWWGDSSITLYHSPPETQPLAQKLPHPPTLAFIKLCCPPQRDEGTLP